MALPCRVEASSKVPTDLALPQQTRSRYMRYSASVHVHPPAVTGAHVPSQVVTCSQLSRLVGSQWSREVRQCPRAYPHTSIPTALPLYSRPTALPRHPQPTCCQWSHILKEPPPPYMSSKGTREPQRCFKHHQWEALGSGIRVCLVGGKLSVQCDT